MGFLRQVMGKKARRQNDGSWQKAVLGSMLQEVGTQPLQTYIGRSQSIVSEWVSLRTVFEVCMKDTGYKGGWMHREL